MKKGFTLIELLVVVLIIGILSAVALPQYQKAVIKSRVATGLARVNALETAEKEFKMANGYYTVDLSLLSIDTGIWNCHNEQSFCQFRVPQTNALWELNIDVALSSYDVYCVAKTGDSTTLAVCKEYGANCSVNTNGYTYCLVRRVE